MIALGKHIVSVFALHIHEEGTDIMRTELSRIVESCIKIECAVIESVDIALRYIVRTLAKHTGDKKILVGKIPSVAHYLVVIGLYCVDVIRCGITFKIHKHGGAQSLGDEIELLCTAQGCADSGIGAFSIRAHHLGVRIHVKPVCRLV